MFFVFLFLITKWLYFVLTNQSIVSHRPTFDQTKNTLHKRKDRKSRTTGRSKHKSIWHRSSLSLFVCFCISRLLYLFLSPPSQHNPLNPPPSPASWHIKQFCLNTSNGKWNPLLQLVATAQNSFTLHHPPKHPLYLYGNLFLSHRIASTRTDDLQCAASSFVVRLSLFLANNVSALPYRV